MKLKKFVVGLALAVTALAASAELTWFDISKSADGKMTWSSAKESAHFSQSENNLTVVVVLGRVTELETGVVHLYQWYVPTSHCRRGYGKVVSTDMSGKYLFDNDFADNSGNIAAKVAAGMCRWVAVEDKAGRSPDLEQTSKGPGIPPAQIDDTPSVKPAPKASPAPDKSGKGVQL